MKNGLRKKKEKKEENRSKPTSMLSIVFYHPVSYRSTGDMTTIGLNKMQVEIQSLFQETVLKFDQEWDRHMTYLDEIVPTVMDQAAGEQTLFLKKDREN